METFCFMVKTPGRLDVLLSANIEGLSRTTAQKLIKNGNVTAAGRIVTAAAYVPKAGERIIAQLPPPPVAVVAAENIALDILYEDKEIIVINKPRGMVVHPGAGVHSGTVANVLVYRAGADARNLPNADTPRPGIVHRIDKDTSGVMVAVKTQAAYECLTKQFAAHSIRREYIALVRGRPIASGVIDKPIARHNIHRVKMAVARRGGKRAVTHFKVIRCYNGYSLIKARLETGRTHQIRVHLAAAGHPVIGDKVYSKPQKNEPPLTGQALHALCLGFFHPNGEYMEFWAKIPQDMLDFI